jgi:flagella basal body P-ring formation protein FlgA
VPTGPTTLERAIRRFVREQLSDMGGAPDLQLSRTQEASKALALSGPEFDFRVRSADVRRLGLVSFEVDILRGSERVQTLHILGDLALRRSVVVAAKPINRGQVVSEEYVRLAERRFRRPEQLGETDPQQVLDKQARRFVDRGAMITARDVKTIPLVRRGDLVTVWNRSRGVSLKTVAKALGTGGLGAVIEVKSERSGRRYTARITGGRTVEAAPHGPGSAPDG